MSTLYRINPVDGSTEPASRRMSGWDLAHRVQALIYRLMPWLLGWWFLVHASLHYKATGDWWESASIFVVAWVLYEYGKERGQLEMADEIERALCQQPTRATLRDEGSPQGSGSVRPS